MDSTKRLFKFQNYDLIKNVGTFWAVLFIVNLFAYGLIIYFDSKVSFGISDNDLLSILGANTMPIIIFFIIYGIIMHHEDFALALSFGVTRGGFYKSVIVNNILIAAIFAIIQGVLQFFDKYIVESLGKKPLVKFGLFNTAEDSILIIILVLFMLYLTIISISNLIGVLQYRYGYKFWIGFGIVAFIVGNFFIKAILGFSNIFTLLLRRWDNLAILLLEILIIIICYSLGYLFIKKANIRK